MISVLGAAQHPAPTLLRRPCRRALPKHCFCFAHPCLLAKLFIGIDFSIHTLACIRVFECRKHKRRSSWSQNAPLGSGAAQLSAAGPQSAAQDQFTCVFVQPSDVQGAKVVAAGAALKQAGALRLARRRRALARMPADARHSSARGDDVRRCRAAGAGSCCWCSSEEEQSAGE